jgi:transposase InsO family protein
MSRKRNPWDNAACESFIKTLKYEEVYRPNRRETLVHGCGACATCHTRPLYTDVLNAPTPPLLRCSCGSTYEMPVKYINPTGEPSGWISRQDRRGLYRDAPTRSRKKFDVESADTRATHVRPEAIITP